MAKIQIKNSFITSSAQITISSSLVSFSGGISAKNITGSFSGSIPQLSSYFKQAGNSFGTTAILGTNDNQALVFETNNSERARIDTNGNVGIGTSSPSYKLDIAGGIKIGGEETLPFAIGSMYLSYNSAINRIYYGDGTGYDLRFSKRGAGATTDFVTFKDTGNVGIGTTSPTNKLSVGVGSPATLGSGDDGLRITDGTRNVQLSRLGSTYSYAGVAGSGSMLYSYDKLNIVADTSNPIIFNTGGSERMRITSVGNVGIGTTTPLARLHLSNVNVNPLSTAIQGESKFVVSGVDGNIDLLSQDDNSTVSNSIGLGRYNATSGALIHKFGIVSWANTGATGSNTGDRIGFHYGTNANVWDSTELVTIKASGNVGIGTTSPGALLDVNGLFRFQQDIRVNNGIDKLILSATSTTTELHSAGTTGIVFKNSGNSEIVRFDAATGNVGIGTSSPATRLHVYSAGGGFEFGVGSSNCYIETIDRASVSKDLNTGYYTRGTGSFTWNNAAYTERMRINGSGNVGIGTTSPVGKLHVVGGGGNGTLVIAGSSITSHFHYGTNEDTYIRPGKTVGAVFIADVGGNVGIGTTSTFAKLHVTGSSTIPAAVFIGNVGIGTTTVNYRLEVLNSGNENVAKFRGSNDTTIIIGGSDSGGSGEQYITYQNVTTAASAWMVGMDDGEDFRFAYGLAGEIDDAKTKVKIGQDGNVGIGTTSPGYTLQVGTGANSATARAAFLGGYTVFENSAGTGNPSITFNNDLDTGILNNGANTLAFNTGGSERVRIDSSGNVGIGTSSPVYKLEVNGNFAAGGTSTIGTTYPQLTLNGTTSQHAYLMVNRTNYESGIQFQTSGTTKWWMYMPSGNDTTLRFYTNQNSSGDILNLTNTGLVGIGTTSPNKKLQIIGSLGKGLNLYEVSIDNLGAAGTQAKRFEIARVFIDYNDWNNTGPIEIEVREGYYSDGRYKRYVVSYGYASSNVGSLWLVEDTGRGSNDFKAEIGAAVQVTGDIYYVPIYIDLDYYLYVDVLVITNRPRTTNASSTAGGVIYINESPTGSNISSFSPDEVTYLSLASSKTYLGYSGNVGIGTSTTNEKLSIYPGTTGGISLQDSSGNTRSHFFIDNTNPIFSTGIRTANYYLDFDSSGGSQNAIRFYTGTSTIGTGTERMRIDSGGNVGIGTSPTNSKLHIYANHPSGYSILKIQTITSIASGGVPSLAFFDSDGTRNTLLYAASDGTYLANEVNKPIIFSTNSTQKMTIASTGLVGIGTTVPASLLHVYSTSAEPAIRLTSTSGSAKTYGLVCNTAWAPGSFHIYDYTADVTRIHISNGGNVGIGVGATSPAAKLYVVSSGGPIARFDGSSVASSGATEIDVLGPQSNGDLNLGIGGSTLTDATNNIQNKAFVTAGTGLSGLNLRSDAGYVQITTGGLTSANERMRITSDGKVGIGLTNPNTKFQVSGSATIGGYNALYFGTGVISLNITAPLYPVLAFYYGTTLAGTVGGYSDHIGLNTGVGASKYISFEPNDAESMRITSGGIVYMGTTTTSVTNGGIVSYGNSVGQFAIGHATGTASGTAYAGFQYNGTQIGSILQSGTTAVTFNTTSDYRLKEDIQPLFGGLDRVNALKPSVYTWKSDGSNGEGFLAHELAEVVPIAVTGQKDAVNDDGTINPQGVDLSKVVPILVAAIQELSAKVKSLETKVQILESK